MVVNSALSYGEQTAYKFYYNKNNVRRIYYCDVLVYGDAQLSTPTDVDLSDDIISFSTVENATEYAFLVITPPDSQSEELGNTNYLYEKTGPVMSIYQAYPYAVHGNILRI